MRLRRNLAYILLSSPFLLLPFLSQANAQTIDAITNGASFVTDWTAPGSVTTIFGSNLANSAVQSSTATLPTSLGGVSVFVNGAAAPLYFVSPGQINFQLPYDVLGNLPTGTAFVNVCRQNSCSPVVSILVEPRAPGILIYGAGQAIAQNSDFTLNSPTNPAATGSFVTVYLAGLGALDNPVATGASAPSAPLSNALATVSATLGGTTAKVTFAGLTPGFVGLAQVNVQIPNLAPGNYSLIITAGSDASSPATLSITGGAAASPQFLMSSVVGDGVTGSPLSSTTTSHRQAVIPRRWSKSTVLFHRIAERSR
jgi:adhesin/invasin